MLKIIPSTNIKNQMFCQKYWQNILTNTKKIPTTDRFNLRDANLEIMNLSNIYSKPGELSNLIKTNDLAQKFNSKLTDEDMILWRGIQSPLDDDSNYVKKLFNKCINLKKGDIFYMPEYSFWADSKNAALTYAAPKIAKRSLLYELSLPKGSEVYNIIYYILRRYSKFICIDNKEVIEGYSKYNHIKLEPLPRDVFCHKPRQ